MKYERNYRHKKAHTRWAFFLNLVPLLDSTITPILLIQMIIIKIEFQDVTSGVA
ncbi:hypothetical protein VCRA2119O147_630028 [Vibrio crassostreae]|nr:hypothetical protein VCRA2119O147_630028 [Vibrio crassostreae]